MKILVTGSGGQLGHALIEQAPDGVTVFGTSRSEMDITDFDQTRGFVRQISPDAIIHAAAFTAVDLAESQPKEAFKVNAMGTRNVALAAEQIGARLCYISTDYVFNGNSYEPYGEYDNTDPQTVYGKSKRAGELLVQSLSSKWFVVRTSWVFGRHGANFVKTMLTNAAHQPSMRVVDDQVGAPTYANDLAALLFEMVKTEKYGIYHASNTGSCSWYEFAREIFDRAGITTELEPCTTEDFPRPALRPRYSVFSHMALDINEFPILRPWQVALGEYLEEAPSEENTDRH